MSGRWAETDAVWSSLTILDAALNDHSHSSSWVNRPQSLVQLDRLNANLDRLEVSISECIDELNATGEVEPHELERMLGENDSDLTNLKSQADQNSQRIGDLADRLDSLLREMDAQLRLQTELLGSIQNDLPMSLKIQTSNGIKSLQYQSGRYRYKHWIDEYTGNYGENLNWLNQVTAAYSKEEQRVSTTRISRTSSDAFARSRALVSKRRKQAAATALKISTENLRRSRDSEIMDIAKSQGYKIQRRAKGKKVHYVLVRYK